MIKTNTRLHVSLIGAPTDIGAGTRGSSMGPEALRVAGLQPVAHAEGGLERHPSGGDVAQREVAFRAQIEEVEPGGGSQAGRRQRVGRHVDGALVLAHRRQCGARQAERAGGVERARDGLTGVVAGDTLAANAADDGSLRCILLGIGLFIAFIVVLLYMPIFELAGSVQ